MSRDIQEPGKHERRLWLWIALGITVIIVIFAIAGKGGSPFGKLSTKKPVPSKAEYQIRGTSLDYRKGMLKTYTAGDLVYVTGVISQIVHDNDLMLDTNHIDFLGYLGDKVYVTFPSKPAVLVGDVVQISARYLGTQKYISVLRTEEEVPLVRGDYITVKHVK